MKRLATLAACLGAFPAAARAIDPPGPNQSAPVSAPRPMARPAAPAPAQTEVVVPDPAIGHHPLPTAPTVPPVGIDDCGRATGCPTSERGKSRFGLGNLFGSARTTRDHGSACGSCGHVSDANFCSSCGSKMRIGKLLHRGDGCGRDRACWDKVKDWFCWHPDYTKSIPCFRPIPYQAPLIAYFPGCQEPTIPVGPACGPAGCAAKADCGPAGCSPAPAGGPASDGGPVDAGRGSRFASVLDSFRTRKAGKSQSDGADMSEPIAPGLRFANPTFSPPPPVSLQTTQPPPAQKPQLVAPASYTRPGPKAKPPAARPLTNP